jgi:hypothetical protein
MTGSDRDATARHAGPGRHHHHVWTGSVPAVVPVLVGALVLMVGTFLPWLRSGEVWRNSYEVWRSAERLGVVSGGPVGVVYVAWFLLPVAAGGLLLAISLHRPHTATALGVFVVVLPGLGAALALRAPLPTGIGVTVTLLGSLLVAASMVLANRAQWRSRRGGIEPMEQV